MNEYSTELANGKVPILLKNGEHIYLHEAAEILNNSIPREKVEELVREYECDRRSESTAESERLINELKELIGNDTDD